MTSSQFKNNYWMDFIHSQEETPRNWGKLHFQQREKKNTFCKYDHTRLQKFLLGAEIKVSSQPQNLEPLLFLHCINHITKITDTKDNNNKSKLVLFVDDH
jgi:hypothetical protein